MTHKDSCTENEEKHVWQGRHVPKWIKSYQNSILYVTTFKLYKSLVCIVLGFSRQYTVSKVFVIMVETIMFFLDINVGHGKM